MARKKKSRHLISGALVVLIAGALTAAFWPRATAVDLAMIERQPMQVTIDEEGRTRVREPYVVSTPVAGRLMRVQVHPGDPVEKGKTVVAHMRPIAASVLDIRTREQANALMAAAEAALKVAQADLNANIAEKSIVDSELARGEKLAASGTLSKAALDRLEGEARAASARVDTAEAAIAMRQAELSQARANLLSFDEAELSEQLDGPLQNQIPLRAPITGTILRVIQQSETTLQAGTPILEIGDVNSDLEILVELISTEAVRVETGDPVIIADWGQPEPLHGSVLRVEPFGFTKFSALGVEEQRVNVVIAIDNATDALQRLGHGYRVEVKIIVWEEEDVLTIPASALFRSGNKWAVFKSEGGVIETHPVRIGQNNGLQAQVVDGLAEGDEVVLYPSAGLSNGMKVVQRQIE